MNLVQQDFVEIGGFEVEASEEQERSASESDEEGNSAATGNWPGSDG